jgi:hypothetical protein
MKPLYCSSACAGLAKRTGTIVKCVQCGKDVYSHKSKPRQFCSKSCARTAANLTSKNPSYSRDISGENNPMYGKGLSGEQNPMYGKRKELSPRWKGGRKVRSDGYVLIIAPENHPYPADDMGSIKYVLEHRHIMEQYLGRYLDPQEVVHHINGNPSDNRIENLRLFANQSDHVRIGHGSE